jgi:regulator of sigma E protease
MSIVAGIIVGILGLALLMVVHEGGHHIAARLFGMRVIKFSIGFGPALYRHQPKGSSTIYQIALIPFLAYVQIAGMNPFEPIDPDDKTSYANASLIGRITTIFAGPLANYLFATVLFFAAFSVGGKMVPSLQVDVVKGGAAAKAKMVNQDRIVAINGERLKSWDDMRRIVLGHANQPLSVEVERQGKPVVLTVTPTRRDDGQGQLGVETLGERQPMALGECLRNSVVEPALLATSLVVGLANLVMGREKVQLTGPLGIVGETGKAAQRGPSVFLGFLAALSTYLGVFNLLPFPALDGGRLMFLGYEAVVRRRPNAHLEARIHAVGLAMLLVLIAVVSVFDIRGH